MDLMKDKGATVELYGDIVSSLPRRILFLETSSGFQAWIERSKIEYDELKSSPAFLVIRESYARELGFISQ